VAELLIGCGNSRVKLLSNGQKKDWTDLVTLDQFEDCKPDVVHDLEDIPYPFEDGEFSEIHAYEVLEHMGRQGDWRFFFAQWNEFYRLLEPHGLFFGTVPCPDSVWAWGDPSHTRIITLEQFVFLSQDAYKQVGATSMTDFRSVYRGNFRLLFEQKTEDKRQMFVLQKV
jgi:hypothetical protein